MAKYLATCIRGVLRQTLVPDEIIVVDDASTDGTSITASSFSVKLLRHNVNRGLGAARNTAIKIARGELIAALDADCYPDPNWLRNLVNALVSQKVDGVCGKLVEAFQISHPDRWRAYQLAQHYGDRPMTTPPFLFGCNTLFKKSALEQVGLYDERFRTNGEDVEIARRMYTYGFKLFYEPRAVVQHLQQIRVVSGIKKLYGRNTSPPRLDRRPLLKKIAGDTLFIMKITGGSILKVKLSSMAYDAASLPYFIISRLREEAYGSER